MFDIFTDVPQLEKLEDKLVAEKQEKRLLRPFYTDFVSIVRELSTAYKHARKQTNGCYGLKHMKRPEEIYAQFLANCNRRTYEILADRPYQTLDELEPHVPNINQRLVTHKSVQRIVAEQNAREKIRKETKGDKKGNHQKKDGRKDNNNTRKLWCGICRTDRHSTGRCFYNPKNPRSYYYKKPAVNEIEVEDKEKEEKKDEKNITSKYEDKNDIAQQLECFECGGDHFRRESRDCKVYKARIDRVGKFKQKRGTWNEFDERRYQQNWRNKNSISNNNNKFRGRSNYRGNSNYGRSRSASQTSNKPQVNNIECESHEHAKCDSENESSVSMNVEAEFEEEFNDDDYNEETLRDPRIPSDEEEAEDKQCPRQ